MRPALLLGLALALVATMTATARAEFVMCIGGQGAAPPAGAVVPPRAHLAFYSDRNLRLPDKVTATIDGKPVKVTRQTTTSSPFNLLTIAIDSDRVGKLVVTYENYAPITYTVRAIEMPKEVTGTISRVTSDDAGPRREEFEGLAIRLPENTSAITAHVKHRPGPGGIWFDIDVALYTPPESQRPMIRVGQFACEANADLASLSRGFDVEVSVTLADGSTRTLTNLAKHMTLPAALPPQPRPKNQRAR